MRWRMLFLRFGMNDIVKKPKSRAHNPILNSTEYFLVSFVLQDVFLRIEDKIEKIRPPNVLYNTVGRGSHDSHIKVTGVFVVPFRGQKCVFGTS